MIEDFKKEILKRDKCERSKSFLSKLLDKIEIRVNLKCSQCAPIEHNNENDLSGSFEGSLVMRRDHRMIGNIGSFISNPES